MLTPEQQKLVNAMRLSGIPETQIQQYLNGTGNGGSTPTAVSIFGGSNLNRTQQIGGTPYKAGTVPPDPFALNPAYRQNVQTILGNPTPAPTANKAGSSTLGNVLKSLTGGGNTSVLDKLKQLGSNVIKNATKPKTPTGNSSAAQPALENPLATQAANAGLDSAVLPDFQAPNFELRDFTDKANQLAAESYGPQYQAIDLAAQGAQNQYQRSDKITAGLYANLVDSINATKAKTAADYAQAGADQAARTAALQQTIGDTYHNNTQQQADVMAKLGIQEAAPQVLDQNTSDASYQQASAAQMGEAQRGQIAAQGAAQGDYLTSVGNAEQTQGTVSRENLLADLGNVLRQYDQQRIGLKGDERSTAQQIADSLQQKDFSLQQANYGGYKDSYDAQVGQVQFGQQQAQAAAAAQQAAQQAAYQRAQDIQQQSNTDRSYELDLSKFQTGLATDQAKLALQQAAQNPGINSAANKDSADPLGKVTFAATQATGDPGKGQTYVNFVDAFVRGLEMNGSSLEKIGNPVAFATQVADNARSQGLDPSVASRVAAAWWANMAK